MLKDQKTHHDVGVDDTGVVADGLEKQEFVAHSFDDDVVDQTSSLHGRVGRVVYRHHATRLAELTHVLQLQPIILLPWQHFDLRMPSVDSEVAAWNKRWRGPGLFKNRGSPKMNSNPRRLQS